MNTKGVEDGDEMAVRTMANVKNGGLMSQMVGGPLLGSNGLSKVFGTWPGDETDAELLSALDEVRGAAVPVEERTPKLRAALLEIMPHLNELPTETYHRLAPLAHAALAVPERTAEMEELIGRLRESMRYLRAIAPMGVMLTAIMNASADVDTLLDHIEGKAKAVSQEVKE